MALQDKKQKSTWRKINNWLHLWLGLTSGIIVFVICLTGVAFVFHDEINNFVNREARFVKVENGAEKLPIDSILESVKHQYPKIMLMQYTSYKDATKSVKIMCFDRSATPSLLGLGNIYVNPYTGKVLKMDFTYGIFRFIAEVHANLLLGKVGSQIVRISTIIFLIELISGLIWWWPKKWNKTNFNKSFKVKWDANWKRLNIDLHNVLGFYALPLAIILTITGLALTYDPVKNAIFTAFSGTTERANLQETLPKADSTKVAMPIADLLAPYEKADVPQITIGIPNPKSGALMIRTENETSMVTYRGDIAYVNMYSGEKLDLNPQLLTELKMENMNLSLHLGTWYGLPAKILTFIICLICTSLPITGFIIWYNRKFKKKRPQKIINA
ncbi:PepSY domain-containing protein [Flavobacterium sp. F-65]|uniref:PepSY domain-containing protein n=1 Tax=Flavobacterium pisciphilum TaxID=2893755 RepID=A0ABS8MQR7_9FLAO|nr:PepSY-associated TM helix domain-containing protein [Flavobacterium sp. F-65]MCC9070571.1 PepSY domain-containing protein [Flavobacterium sp. F-65]